MFDIDRWREIFESIRSNILRTVLSGFTVALGLYIFIVLFGIGSGLKNAFTEGFARDASNLITIFAGKTTIAYGGLQSDRQIVLKNDDYEQAIKADPDKLESSTARYNVFYLIYLEKFNWINQAIEREKEIKNLSRDKKLNLIKEINPNLEFWNEHFK